MTQLGQHFDMGECRDLPNAGKLLDHELMERQELRAIANYFRSFHGADSFVTALEYARSLAEGQLATAAVWNQIAEEISQIETSDTLARCLSREAG